MSLSSDWAAAQTWVPPRTTPRLRELIALDRTGEPNWLFGAEDVLGDGVARFEAAEQALDLRSAYVAFEGNRFWLRAYVSEQSAPAADLKLFVFVDADQNRATGGRAVAPEIDASFVEDESAGGYDYVLGIQADTALVGVWQWASALGSYELAAAQPLMAAAEAGRDLDPLQLNGAEHGYLQAAVARAPLGLRLDCTADLLLRSARAAGAGDLYLGAKLACAPADGNANGIADAAEMGGACREDAQCPARGLCIESRCVYPHWCEANADCADSERCGTAGYCELEPGSACSDAEDCAGRLCADADVCRACARDAECAAGERCAVDGRCVGASDAQSVPGSGGVVLGDEKVQGGAFTCAVRAPGATGEGGGLVLVGLLALMRRGRRAASRVQAAGPRG